MVLLGGAQSRSVKQMVAMGADRKTAKKIKTLSNVYYGRTTAPVKQEKARSTATNLHLTLQNLLDIETQVRKLDNKSHAWQVRVVLARTLPKDLQRVARRLLRQFNTRHAHKLPTSLWAKDVKGTTLMDLHVRGPAYMVQQVLDAARSEAEATGKDPAIAALTQMGGVPKVRPAVVIPVDSRVTGVTQEERNSFRLSLTDGSTMTSLEFAQAELDRFGWVIVVDPVTGEDFGMYKFDVDENARFADPFERQKQALKTPVCVVDGCGCGADKCQMHHVQGYAQGGKTTSSNLTMLCPFHNGRNDDDPTKPRHGRIEKIDGLDYFVPLFGGEPRLNMHPAAQGGAIRLAREMMAI